MKEYSILEINLNIQLINETLNKMARQGWALKSSNLLDFQTIGYSLILIFERDKQ